MAFPARKLTALLIAAGLALGAPAGAQTLGYVHVANRAALGATSAAVYPHGVWRDGYTGVGDAPALFYLPSGSPCSLNAGAGDGGSQVPTSDGKCWLASFGGALDASEWGKPYPLTMYAAPGGSSLNHGGANYCLISTDPCTVQGAIGQILKFNVKQANYTISLAAGTYDTSLLVAGRPPGTALAGNGQADGGFLILSGAGGVNNATIINPTTGGGGCAQNLGDGLTASQYATVWLQQLVIGTSCPGRSDVFIQNWAYLGGGPDLVWGSAPVDLLHVEALAYAEFYGNGGGLFNVKAGATAQDALNYGTGGIINFDGSGAGINFLGNATFTWFVNASQGGVMTWLPGTVVNLNGHTVTGSQWAMGSGSYFINASAAAVPGSGFINQSNSFYVTAANTVTGPVSTSSQGSQLGSAASNCSTPTPATTNVVLYNASSTNWAGLGSDGGGNICFINGTTAPATRFGILTDGSLFAPFTVSGGGKGPGTLNIGGPYYESGAAGVTCAGAPTASFASTGGIVTHC